MSVNVREEECVWGDVGEKKNFRLDLGLARVQITFVIERARKESEANKFFFHLRNNLRISPPTPLEQNRTSFITSS